MRLIFLTLFFQLSTLGYSQYHVIKGKVLDVSGNPISYATIKSIKTHETLSCDKDGTFSFQTPYRHDSLICTHISFQEKVEILSGVDTVNFIMLPNNSIQYSIKIQNDYDKDYQTEDTALITQWLKEKEKLQDSLISTNTCDLPMRVIEIPPKYKNGEDDFEKDFEKIYDSLNYPKFKGIIKVGLSIDKQGVIYNIIQITGIDTFIDTAVITTLKNMHSWRPAIQNGRNVAFYLEVKIEH